MSIDDEPVTTLEDLRGDLAGRYKWTPSSGASVDPAIVEADMAAIGRDGYIIWENLLSADECRQIKETVEPWLVHPGRNAFEGRHTQRVYSLLSRTRICDRLVDHPRVLAVLDRILMDNYLLSALQAINIQPGESAQLAHHDDGFYPIPRPREPLAAATIWAIDDFTADNGATVLYPRAATAGAAVGPSPTIRRSRSSCPPAPASSSSARSGTAAAPTAAPTPDSPSPPSTASRGCGRWRPSRCRSHATSPEPSPTTSGA